MSSALDDVRQGSDPLLLHLQQLTEVIAQQNASLASLQIKHDAVLVERDAAQAEIEKLRLLIRQLQRGQFGRRSEKLHPDQLQLGLEDLEQTVAAAEAAQEAATRSSPPRTPRAPRRRNLGALPAHLPRVEVRVDLEDKSCPCCGEAMHAIGEDTSEMLDVVPAQLQVKVLRRPRYGCRACEEAVVQAPAPERPITGGMASEALLAYVLVAKYADFLPLYRQAGIFARQGIELDRSTLCDWVGRACWWLEPLWRLLRRYVMSSTRIFADDTPLPVLDPGRGRTKTGRLWGYAVDDRPWSGSTPPAVVYLYAEDRKGEHPATHLAGFRGVLQVDGYSGFKSLLENRPPGAIRLAFCWAHCRRRFYELHQSTGSPLAEEALRRIGELYAIEAEVRGRTAEEQRAARQERSKPLVEALQAWLTAQLERVSGKSGLAEAIRYALRHWPGLVLFLEDGRVELDTNSIERAIRSIALGRKNSLFAGSDGGARHWAIVASLVATAKLNGVESLAWLTDVLERMVSGRTKAHELEQLLPWNWKTERLAAAVDA
ncbi:MAG TPA: IS66 family transposase [Geminicoccaceae bacterium]|nr:IS66 family transposase [Geminicoccaceae bacterium]